MNRNWLLVCFLALVLASPSASTAVPQAGETLLADDAYHYRLFADGRHDENYIEWWYFNFYDEEQDLQAIITYFIADPDNLTRQGVAQVAAVAYTSEGIVSVIDQYSPDSFAASDEHADVGIEGSAIEVLDRHSYRIVGASQNGRLAWDLVYLNDAAPWFAADLMPVGLFRWEQMSWLVYMPGAQVGGWLSVDGKVHLIDAPGYHDHNWGEWIFTNALWNWAQYFEPGLALEMGDFINRPLGVVSIEYQGERIVFPKEQYRLTHTHWGFDEENRQRFPIESSLTAENEVNRLTLTLEAIETHPLRGDLPFPLPDAIIYEQTARYQGELWQRNAQGEWSLLVSFSGNGFKEYTARKF